MFDSLQPVHYIPILTTLLSAIFLFVLLKRYSVRRSGTHLLWWAAGIFTYGSGTALEATVTLHGNTPLLNQLWYVFGAILGGYPLAQGSVYLHFSKKTANLLTAITAPILVVVSICVFLSPTRLDLLQSYRPGGAALEWQWVRYLTPFINGYAAIFLIGSAIMSAVYFFKEKFDGPRALGNALIAFGALLPGIGGSMAKGGLVEALYIGEFVGLIFIWAGYQSCILSKAVVEHGAQLRILESASSAGPRS